jgi:hypothetical protein
MTRKVPAHAILSDKMPRVQKKKNIESFNKRSTNLLIKAKSSE